MSQLRKEVKEKTLGYILAALGLVAGLAWNEAITALINTIFPLGKDTLLAKFIYAIVITIVLIVVTMWLVRIFNKGENRGENGTAENK